MTVFAKNLRKRTRKMQGVSPTLPKENLIFFYTTSCVPFHLERCFFFWDLFPFLAFWLVLLASTGFRNPFH